ncbi:NADAR family protein [Brevibacillus nitrificans]|uniref:NADAR family protein n=1 Tax=Brevibacillus nitrificans TaxID=651560 RepID=UPI0028602B77|nr:NADAR family protein [Brevibacillus nitrificans]MDR7314697.1 ribA/ribD-fused uncharacterized protein [Brevibacillus nitrificans]
MSEKFTFFWRSNSPFSQWYMQSFSLDGITFNCAEQAMMYGKAVLFHDREIAEKVLKTAEPREQKQLGRLVNNFDDKIWKEKSKHIVYAANKAKFTQNQELLKALFRTAGTTLVEANPYDKIWGIGLAEEDSRARDRKQWMGSNLLGESLTEPREELMSKQDNGTT